MGDKRYPSEELLCARFVGVARAHGFKVYPETEGFDLLLVAGPECSGFREGDQVGVHAKLVPNVAVLAQALPRPVKYRGPDYYAVLVPKRSKAFSEVARALRITEVTAEWLDGDRFTTLSGRRWFRCEPQQRCWVPEHEHDLPAGVPSPRTLSKWKQAAIKLCLLCEERGYLTSRDFADAGISMTRWRKLGWLRADGAELERAPGRRALTRYVLVPEARPPHLAHKAIADSMRKQGASCSA